MAHPAGEASTPVSAEAVTDFITDQFLGGSEEPEQEDEEENPEGEQPEGETDEAEEAESEEQEEDDGEAPEPIAAPVSWDKDAKEAFAQLPRELQETVAEREAQRDKAIQSATTEAANAKRNAVAEANSLFADQQRQYASHLEQIVASHAPQAPDPTLAATDPTAYVQALAYFNAQSAQYQQMQQQAQKARDEADQRDNLTRQHELQETHRLMAQELGETWTDTAKRQELLTGLEQVGAALGYTPELILQANATDLKALVAASEWKAKADKYDKLIDTKMEAVRAAKGKPRVNKPGTTAGAAERTSRNRDAAWQRAKTERSGDAYAAVLENMGFKL